MTTKDLSGLPFCSVQMKNRTDRCKPVLIILFAPGQPPLFFPKVSSSTLGKRAFVYAATVLWNVMPLTLRTSKNYYYRYLFPFTQDRGHTQKPGLSH